jgi:hypothetical protein
VSLPGRLVSLRIVREFLASLEDAKLLLSLRIARDKGRNDYPVRGRWVVSPCGCNCRSETVALRQSKNVAPVDRNRLGPTPLSTCRSEPGPTVFAR